MLNQLLPVNVDGGRRRCAYVERDNEISLHVYAGLLCAMQACEAAAVPYLNVVAVFFHDLMIMLSGVALRARELQGPYHPFEASIACRVLSLFSAL